MKALTRSGAAVLTAATFTIVAGFASTASATLIGDSVHVTYRFPDFATVFADAGTQTIAAGTVFDLSATAGVTVTFSDSQITITNLTPGEYDTDAFNGLDIAFLSGPAITNVTVDAASSSLFAPGSVLTFSANDIDVDIAGTCTGCQSGEEIILDVTTANTVPEPLTLSLFGAGLIGAAAMRRRKAK